MKEAIGYIKEVVENDGAVDDAMERLKCATREALVGVEVIDFNSCVVFSKKQRSVFVGKSAQKIDIENASDYLVRYISPLTEK